MGGKCFRQSVHLREHSSSEANGCSFSEFYASPSTEISGNSSKGSFTDPLTEMTQCGVLQICTDCKGSSTPKKPAPRRRAKPRKVQSDPAPVEQELPKSYAVECKALINSGDAKNEYQDLKQKAFKLFSSTTTSPNSKKVSKHKLKKPKKGVSEKLPEQIVQSINKIEKTEEPFDEQEQEESIEKDKTDKKEKSQIPTLSVEVSSKSGETESFSSRITEDDGDDSHVESFNYNKDSRGLNPQRYNRATQRKHLQRQHVSYVKKVQISTFMEKLDKEIADDLTRCSKFYSSIIPLCKKIQQHVQAFAQTVFNGTSRLLLIM